MVKDEKPFARDDKKYIVQDDKTDDETGDLAMSCLPKHNNLNSGPCVDTMLNTPTRISHNLREFQFISDSQKKSSVALNRSSVSYLDDSLSDDLFVNLNMTHATPNIVVPKTFEENTYITPKGIKKPVYAPSTQSQFTLSQALDFCDVTFHGDTTPRGNRINIDVKNERSASAHSPHINHSKTTGTFLTPAIPLYTSKTDNKQSMSSDKSGDRKADTTKVAQFDLGLDFDSDDDFMIPPSPQKDRIPSGLSFPLNSTKNIGNNKNPSSTDKIMNTIGWY